MRLILRGRCDYEADMESLLSKPRERHAAHPLRRILCRFSPLVRLPRFFLPATPISTSPGQSRPFNVA